MVVAFQVLTRPHAHVHMTDVILSSRGLGLELLLPSLEPETYRSWAKALAIAPSATSTLKQLNQKKMPKLNKLLPSLEPETYRSWAKALAIAPSATSKKLWI
ncbi:hypothetical protein DVH24_005739 [Malus domestica]|uniref:Uncharacterized protein n=1 Tax=Malus domestica TaxID=3750 RepID=A0A498IJE8_MALDO|nr:hypothetical protein DVH24_005739 [Malus domestica]